MGDPVDPSDDEGPAGPPPMAEPAGAQPPPAPEHEGMPLLQAGLGGLARIEVAMARQSRFYNARAKGAPRPEQILARTTQNLDTTEYFEQGMVVVDMDDEERTQPLPLLHGVKTCHLRTVL